MLSFISMAVEKQKYGVDFCCIFFCRPDWWWGSLFYVGGLVLSSFLHSVLISRVVICRFSCHLLFYADVYMLHAGSLTGGFSSCFPFIVCEEKEAVSFLKISSISFFFLTLRTVSMFIVCSRTWYQTWEAVWLIICSDLILRYWYFLSVGVFALHLPNYFYFEVFPSSCEFTRFSIGWLAVFFSLEFELQWALHDISVRWLAGFRPQFF